MTPSPAQRIARAAASESPGEALLYVAGQLKEEGLGQNALVALFNTCRAEHENDADETVYEAVLEVLDLVGGWCPPHRALFP